MKQRKGFTIIEVVLVLAIAGLIFLMVFLALPALQRGQRNTARRNDVGIVAAAIQTWMANNNGRPPRGTPSAPEVWCVGDGGAGLAQGSGFCSYLSEVSGNVLWVVENREPATDVISVFLNSKCATERAGATGHGNYGIESGTRLQSAVVIKLEGDGGQLYCVDV